MESNLIKVPFDLEMAKRITNGEINGKIVTRTGDNVRIICFDWESTDEELPIIGLARNNKYELMHFYNRIGYTNKDGLQSKFDLFLEIPEYITFKDGDIYKTGRGGIAIYNANYKASSGNTPFYVGVRFQENDLVFHVENNDCGFGELDRCTLNVTEEERQEFIGLLSDSEDPRAKEYLKRFLNIELKPKYKFNPFDKVLVRDDKEHDWNADLFSHINKLGNCVCLGSSWVYCIPYNDQTAHLLGTNKNWED